MEKLEGIIREKSDDLKVYVGTNDITNILKLLNNVKKKLIKFLKNHH